MARNKNTWYGTGRLGADPEIRHTQQGDIVANLRVASTQSWTDKSGEKKDKTFWAKVVVWGKAAENCEKYCKKGDLIRVEGPLVNREWTDRDGITRYSTEVTISGFNGDIEFLASPSRQGNANTTQPSQQKQHTQSQSYGSQRSMSDVDASQDPLDDEIPF